MAEHAYTSVPARIPELLEKIRETGVPTQKVTTEWLDAVGFKSKNDHTLLRVLRFIQFIDASDMPTDFWRKYRGGNSRYVLAEAIRQGYSDLFTTYRDAYDRSDEDLENYFTAKSPHLASSTIRRIIETFRALCALADFGSMVDSLVPDSGVPVLPSRSSVIDSQPKLQSLGLGSGLTININIQLALPETKDPEFYEQFFSALKKHFVDGGVRNGN